MKRKISKIICHYVSNDIFDNEKVNKIIKKDNLGNVKNNIIDTKTLSSNSENTYELRIWVTGDYNSSEWMGKTYNYKVSVNPIAN